MRLPRLARAELHGLVGSDTGKVLLLVTTLALALRVALALLTVDVPGDGPTRANAAYEWALSPRVVTFGVWPPGLLYLSGLASRVVPDPFWSVRLVNLALGAASIPVLFLLVRRVFTTPVAWMAASLLVVFPLHLEVSATSLAEGSFAFEILLGLVLIRGGAASPAALSLGLLAFFWASMTRYEAWWFAPVVIGAVATSTRRPLAIVGAVVATLGFPVAWSIGNYLAFGDPNYGFTMARKGAEIAGTSPVSFPIAFVMLCRTVIRELGWPGALSAVAGTLLAATTWRRWWTAERGLYAGVTMTFWTLMTLFAMRRGHSVFNRYLLVGLVLLLPYVAWPWARLGPRAPKAVAIFTVVIAFFMVYGRLTASPPWRWVSWQRPTDMRALVAWIRQGPYRDDAIVLTEMGWTASYFSLCWPEVSSRRLIVSAWSEDYEIREFFTHRVPTLLVTWPEDEALRARIESIITRPMITSTPVRTFGSIAVYPLESPSSRP